MTFKTKADGSPTIDWKVDLPADAPARLVVRTLLSFMVSTGYSEESVVRAMKEVVEDYDRYKEDALAPERVLS